MEDHLPRTGTAVPTLLGIHHAAIICADYAASRRFYTGVLGLRILAENYRATRDSWKLDLQLPDGSQVELFSMPLAPGRPSYPEACGLRHLAFAVRDMQSWVEYLQGHEVALEPVRLDEYTGKRFVFFRDPDQLPIELYEVAPPTTHLRPDFHTLTLSVR
jgi:glyoxylase I family protein